MLTVTKSVFEKMKARWEKIEAGSLDKLDQELVETMRLLNQHPDIVTLFSCQGHPDHPRWKETYLLCAIQNVQVAMRYYDLVRNELPEDERYRFRLSFTTRKSPFRDEEGGDYPAVVFNFSRGKRPFPIAFEIAARRLIEEINN